MDIMDPKHERHHEVMSDLWDNRDKETDMSLLNQNTDEFTDPEQHLDHCVICGGEIDWDGEVAEMHDPAMYDQSLTPEERMVAQERIPNSGLVHAQCGLDKGWSIS